MHSCAIKYLNTNQQLEFVKCSMASSYPPESLSACSRNVGIDDGTQRKIKSCSESVEGDQLLATNGELTAQVKPRLSFVPTITYNGVYDFNTVMESQSGFKGVVCEELNDKAEFCDRRGRNLEHRGERRAKRYLNDN